MEYLAFFIIFCFVVGLAKMVTLTNNIVYKKSAQYRKHIWAEQISQQFFKNDLLISGISVGPLVCGVIGATKPVFDIWGDTVNEASRMDSTGTLGCIQVSHRTSLVCIHTACIGF
jgi:hypothetical protein